MQYSSRPPSINCEDVLEKTIQGGADSVHGDDSEERTISSEHSTSTNHENEYLEGFKLYTLFLALILFILMIALDAAIISTALPRITDDFHTIANIGWYGAAYMLTNSSLQPLTGKVYKYGALKISLLVFVIIFELGSILCATATSSMMLVIGRAVAGMGGAGISSGSLILINNTTAPAQRPTIMGITMSMFGVGQVLGPLIGGALTQHASWRWCFWINLPIGGAAVFGIFAIRLPKQDERPKLTRATFLQNFDIVGFLLFAPASIMLLLALQWGGIDYAWSSATVVGLLCGSAATYIVFAFWERRQGDDAMFPASLLRQRVFLCSTLFSFFFGASLLELAYCLPLWFQVVKKNSPTTSAVHTLPTFISQILFAVISGPLSNRIGYFSPLALAGACIAATGAGLMVTFDASTSMGRWIGYQILSGSGRGLAFQQPVNTTQATLPKTMIATGMALVIWAQFFGGAIALALGQTILTSLLRHTLHEFAPEVDPALIVHAGATNYESVVPSATEQGQVLLAYNRAITRTILLPTVAALVAAIVALGMGWKRIMPTQKDSRDHTLPASRSGSESPRDEKI